MYHHPPRYQSQKSVGHYTVLALPHVQSIPGGLDHFSRSHCWQTPTHLLAISSRVVSSLQSFSKPHPSSGKIRFSLLCVFPHYIVYSLKVLAVFVCYFCFCVCCVPDTTLGKSRGYSSDLRNYNSCPLKPCSHVGELGCKQINTQIFHYEV